MNKSLYIGLMSGTSADGIDGVVVDFKRKRIDIKAKTRLKIPKKIKDEILSYRKNKDLNIKDLYELDYDLSMLFSDCVKKLLKESGIKSSQIEAIGSHGQTIHHSPDTKKPFTLQITDPNIISTQTGIRTVSDFRRMDIASGGQGAPLAPIFHQEFLSKKNKIIAVINIGGIANISILDGKNNELLGFDSGPGNCLMDEWIREKRNKNYDDKGKIASSGETNIIILKKLLNDNFFKKAPPKSTGTEVYNLCWLKNKVPKIEKYSIKDIQSTLTDLTVETIKLGLKKINKSFDLIYICGGGYQNKYLISELEKELTAPVLSTIEKGIDANYFESIGFAWLAKQRLKKQYFQLDSITGSKDPLMLGTIWEPPKIK